MQDSDDFDERPDDAADEIIDDSGAEREPPDVAQQLMRFTIIESAGTVSFVAPYNTLKALVAGVSRTREPHDLVTLLENASRYDDTLTNRVLDGLALFDEHHPRRPASPGSSAFAGAASADAVPTPADDRTPDPAAIAGRPDEATVLRVIDPATRDASLAPVGVGLVIINLPARRIIQVANTYGYLKRQDRGRYFVNGAPTARLYFYRLPSAWAMLP